MLGAGGFFNNRLKYLISKLDANIKPTEPTQTQTSREEDLLFLKNCIIQNTDLNVIVSKLNSTRSLREGMMTNVDIDLRECFPFFFVMPGLVSSSKCSVVAFFNSTCFTFIIDRFGLC